MPHFISLSFHDAAFAAISMSIYAPPPCLTPSFSPARTPFACSFSQPPAIMQAPPRCRWRRHDEAASAVCHFRRAQLRCHYASLQRMPPRKRRAAMPPRCFRVPHARRHARTPAYAPDFVSFAAAPYARHAATPFRRYAP